MPTKDNSLTKGLESQPPDVERLIAESLRVRGSVAIRIEPRVFDLHSGTRGGYRSLRGQGFTLEIGSAKAVVDTIKLMRQAIELGLPLELAKCAKDHPAIWFHADSGCGVCAEKRRAEVAQETLQLLVRQDRVEKAEAMQAMREVLETKQ